MINFERLKEPFYSYHVNWKVQSRNKNKTKGMMVTYVEGRPIMDRLDEVVGPENWKDEYLVSPNVGIICTLYIKIDGEWVGKSDGAPFTDVEATKGAITDAFKRAAVKWGIGRYFYDIPVVWVDLDENGRPKTIPTIPTQFLPKDDPALKSTGKKELPKQTDIDKEKLDFAKQIIIQPEIGVPLAGKTLGDALAEPEIGHAVLLYLSGKKPNKAGNTFDPGDDASLVALQQGALLLYNECVK